MDLLLIFSILQPFFHSKGKGLCIGILKRICMTLLGMGKWSESPYTANIILIKAWHLFSCSLGQTACCLELEIWKAEELPTVQREYFVLLFKMQLRLQTFFCCFECKSLKWGHRCFPFQNEVYCVSHIFLQNYWERPCSTSFLTDISSLAF